MNTCSGQISESSSVACPHFPRLVVVLCSCLSFVPEAAQPPWPAQAPHPLIRHSTGSVLGGQMFPTRVSIPALTDQSHHPHPMPGFTESPALESAKSHTAQLTGVRFISWALPSVAQLLPSSAHLLCPHPVQPSPVQPSQAQSSPAQPSPAHSG